MFNKLKTTILTVGIAEATLLGSGQAWALDLSYNSYPNQSGTGEVPIPGCDSVPGVPGGVWHMQHQTPGQFQVRAGTGSSGGPGGASITIYAPNDIQQWGGETDLSIISVAGVFSHTKHIITLSLFRLDCGCGWWVGCGSGMGPPEAGQPKQQ